MHAARAVISSPSQKFADRPQTFTNVTIDVNAKVRQPRVLTVIASRSFRVAAPAVWNNLPQTVVTSASVPVVKSRLKTHIFRIAFQRCSTRVQDLDSSPTRVPFFGTRNLDLDLDLRPVDLNLFGLGTSGLETWT